VAAAPGLRPRPPRHTGTRRTDIRAICRASSSHAPRAQTTPHGSSSRRPPVQPHTCLRWLPHHRVLRRYVWTRWHCCSCMSDGPAESIPHTEPELHHGQLGAVDEPSRRCPVAVDARRARTAPHRSSASRFHAGHAPSGGRICAPSCAFVYCAVVRISQRRAGYSVTPSCGRGACPVLIRPRPGQPVSLPRSFSSAACSARFRASASLSALVFVFTKPPLCTMTK
jgi:hypothetical protein